MRRRPRARRGTPAPASRSRTRPPPRRARALRSCVKGRAVGLPAPAQLARRPRCSPGSVMLPSSTASSASKRAMCAVEPAASSSPWPAQMKQRRAVERSSAFPHALGGEHAAVVVLEDRLGAAPSDATVRTAQRRPAAPARAPSGAWASSSLARKVMRPPRSSSATMCRSNPPASDQHAVHERAPEQPLPPRLVRAADDDVADAVRAREVEQRRHRVARLQAAHLARPARARARCSRCRWRCASESMRVGDSSGVST